MSLTDEAKSAADREAAPPGYSPYDSAAPVARKAAAEEPKPKKTDLRRLSEWMKLRQQYERNKNKE